MKKRQKNLMFFLSWFLCIPLLFTSIMQCNGSTPLISAEVVASGFSLLISGTVPEAVDASLTSGGTSAYYGWKAAEETLSGVLLPTIKGGQIKVDSIKDWMAAVNTNIHVSDAILKPVIDAVDAILVLVPTDQLGNFINSNQTTKYIFDVLSAGFTAFDNVIIMELQRHPLPSPAPTPPAMFSEHKKTLKLELRIPPKK